MPITEKQRSRTRTKKSKAKQQGLQKIPWRQYSQIYYNPTQKRRAKTANQRFAGQCQFSKKTGYKSIEFSSENIKLSKE